MNRNREACQRQRTDPDFEFPVDLEEFPDLPDKAGLPDPLDSLVHDFVWPMVHYSGRLHHRFRFRRGPRTAKEERLRHHEATVARIRAICRILVEQYEYDRTAFMKAAELACAVYELGEQEEFALLNAALPTFIDSELIRGRQSVAAAERARELARERQLPPDQTLCQDVAMLHNQQPSWSWSRVCDAVGKKYRMTGRAVRTKTDSVRWKSR